MILFIDLAAGPSLAAQQSKAAGSIQAQTSATAGFCSSNTFDVLQSSNAGRELTAAAQQPAPRPKPDIYPSKAAKSTAQLIQEVMDAHECRRAGAAELSASALAPYAEVAEPLGKCFDLLPLDTLNSIVCLLAPRDLAMLSATCHGFRWA